MNGQTLLLRQVNPKWLKDDGSVAYLAFRPFPKDQDRVSVYDGDQITAEAAWRHYASNSHGKSIGVFAVTVKECESQQTKPGVDGVPYPEHAFIDFTGLNKRDTKNAAIALAEFASGRGCHYHAPEPVGF